MISDTVLPDSCWCFLPTNSKNFPNSHQISAKKDHTRSYLNRGTKHSWPQQLKSDKLFFLGNQHEDLADFGLHNDGESPLRVKIPIFHHYCSCSNMGVHLFLSVFNVLPISSNFPNFRLGKSSIIFFPGTFKFPLFSKTWK